LLPQLANNRLAWNRRPGGALTVELRPRSGSFRMSILISILITFVVIVLVLYLINMLPLDGRARQIVRVIVIIIGIVSLLRYLSVF
jgi:hypothetical protein